MLSKYACRSTSMTRVLYFTIASATRRTASWAEPLGAIAIRTRLEVRFKDGLQDELEAPWTTRSRMVGIERTRTFVPPSFGIAFCRNRMG